MTVTINPSARPYPRGVRPHFFESAERRREIENEIFAALRGAGYREIILPIIDSSEPYRDVVDESARRRSYRFIDREGEILEIRSDFTPLVARSLAPVLDSLTLPVRVCYRGDVVRCENGRLSDDREFYQIGAELLSIPEPRGDAELIRTAVEAVRTAGVEPLVVISSEELMDALLQDVGNGARSMLRQAVSDKHLGEVETLSKDLNEEKRHFLLAICSGFVTANDLRVARMTALVDAMEEVRSMLGDVRVTLAYDDIDAVPSYYTGIRFKVFDESGRIEIARGGRYDRLYGSFGFPVAAVGFTLSLDRLEDLR